MVPPGRWDSGGVMMATNRAAVRAMGVAVVSVGMFLGGAAQGQSCLSTASSTEKASSYRRAWEQGVAGQPACLGGYAFLWGNKQEATATWFG